MYVLFALMHHYILGKPNTGKTTVLLNEALDAIAQGETVLFIDPIGDASEILLSCVTDALVFDVTDEAYPVPYNPLERGTVRHLLAVLRSVAGLSGVSTPSFDQSILQSAKLVLQTKDPTLVAMHRVLIDPVYRQKLPKKDTRLARYWTRFGTLTDRRQEDITASAISQLDLLLADSRVVNILFPSQSAFAVKDTPLLVVRLPVLELGINVVATLSMMLIAELFHGTPSPHRVFIDNVDLVAQPLLAHFLSLGTRRGISFTMAHQYLDQVSDEMQSAFLGYCGYQTYFQLSLKDAKTLEETMEWNNSLNALHLLKRYQARVVTPTEVTEEFLPPFAHPQIDTFENVVKHSRNRYASQRAHIEADIQRFFS